MFYVRSCQMRHQNRTRWRSINTGFNQQGFDRFSNVWANCLSVHFWLNFGTFEYLLTSICSEICNEYFPQEMSLHLISEIEQINPFWKQKVSPWTSLRKMSVSRLLLLVQMSCLGSGRVTRSHKLHPTLVAGQAWQLKVQLFMSLFFPASGQRLFLTLHYGKVSMGSVTFIFHWEFSTLPLIFSASKYFR